MFNEDTIVRFENLIIRANRSLSDCVNKAGFLVKCFGTQLGWRYVTEMVCLQFSKRLVSKRVNNSCKMGNYLMFDFSLPTAYCRRISFASFSSYPRLLRPFTLHRDSLLLGNHPVLKLALILIKLHDDAKNGGDFYKYVSLGAAGNFYLLIKIDVCLRPT